MNTVQRVAFWGCWCVLAAAHMGCRSPYYADRGAAVGGLAGGLTGAALGDRHGNAAAGALVGSAVGALTGAAVGDSIDADIQRHNAMIQQRTGVAMSGRATISDVLTLAKSGLSDDVITNHIRTHGVAASLTPSEIIQLHDNGVSETVINVMQQAAADQSTARAAGNPPVVIRESYVAPPYWGPYYRYGPPRLCRPHHQPRGLSWGVTFAN